MMTSQRIQGQADLLALVLFIIGILLALGAHWASKKAEERSRELYEQIVGPEHAQGEMEGAWTGALVYWLTGG
jgi:hypothetical protein